MIPSYDVFESVTEMLPRGVPKKTVVEIVAVLLVLLVGATYIAATMSSQESHATRSPMFAPNADLFAWPSPPPFTPSNTHPHLSLVVESMVLLAKTMPDFACIHAANLYDAPAPNVAVALVSGEIVVLYDPRIVWISSRIPTFVRSISGREVRVRQIGREVLVEFSRMTSGDGGGRPDAASSVKITSERTSTCLQTIDGLT